MIKEAIILAGGLGTRLRETVPELPKCMAPVDGRPFIGYVIDYLRMQGIERFIFSIGYKAEAIQEYLKNAYPTLSYEVAFEQEPLGTGGAIKLSLKKSIEKDVLVTNGDTLFKINIDRLYNLHSSKKSECTLALKPLENFDRYGVVEVDDERRIESFLEKKFYRQGLINGGVYIINRDRFLKRDLPMKFSLEKEYLEAYYKEGHFYALAQDGYFIDIGIPQDFFKANTDLKKPTPDLKNIDKSWTLFLDRDGVINNELAGNYVKSCEEFVFSDGVLQALPRLSEKFGRIVVVSNQRGIGKGLMTEKDLQKIHLFMEDEIAKNGGRISRIYFCPHIDSTSFNRKPNPGMALQSIKDDPEIDLRKSIIAGNKLSDMQFGRAAGMYTVFISSTNPEQIFPHPDIDFKFTSLLAFTESL